MRELQILVDQRCVGTLREDDKLWVLTYDADWARRDDGFDLSPALPRSTLQHRDGATVRPVQWYFDNLLPAGALRRLVAQDAGLARLIRASAMASGYSTHASSSAA